VAGSCEYGDGPSGSGAKDWLDFSLYFVTCQLRPKY
jgi:hypothetical protein